MPIKEFEGAKWIPVSEHEEALAATARQKSAAETRVTTLERELETAKAKGATADGAAAEITELRQKLAAADARYERHSAMAAHGITDPDVRDAIEWAHERANSKLAKKDQRSLEDDLAAWAEDPESAPTSIRHHLQGGTTTTTTTTTGTEGGGTEGTEGGGTATTTTTAAGSGTGTPAGKRPPPRPKQAPNKPGVQGKPLTLEEIYSADGKQLDELMKQYHGQAAE